MDSARYPRLNPGDTLGSVPAVFWNRLVDIAEWYDQTQLAPALKQAKKTPTPPPYAVVKVKNATEAVLGIGSIVALAGSVFDPGVTQQLSSFRRKPILIGGEPESPADIGRFGIVVEPIPVDGSGDVAVSGFVSCKIDMDFQDRPFADIIGGDTGKLKGCEYGGAEIIYVEGMNDDPMEWEAGTKEALVRIGAFNSPPLIVSWDGILEFGTPVTAFVHGDAGRTARTISLEGSIIGSFSGQELEIVNPGELAWAHFHRPSGLFELGANTRMFASVNDFL
jgi:hypothetical protein